MDSLLLMMKLMKDREATKVCKFYHPLLFSFLMSVEMHFVSMKMMEANDTANQTFQRLDSMLVIVPAWVLVQVTKTALLLWSTCIKKSMTSCRNAKIIQIMFPFTEMTVALIGKILQVLHVPVATLTPILLFMMAILDLSLLNSCAMFCIIQYTREID